MLASTSADNLEVIESVLASTMAEFLQLSGQPSVDTEAAASREQGSREQQVAVYERTAAAEPLQLHDTGALEDALERAEKKRVETAAKGQVRTQWEEWEDIPNRPCPALLRDTSGQRALSFHLSGR